MASAPVGPYMAKDLFVNLPATGGSVPYLRDQPTTTGQANIVAPRGDKPELTLNPTLKNDPLVKIADRTGVANECLEDVVGFGAWALAVVDREDKYLVEFIPNFIELATAHEAAKIAARPGRETVAELKARLAKYEQAAQAEPVVAKEPTPVQEPTDRVALRPRRGAKPRVDHASLRGGSLESRPFRRLSFQEEGLRKLTFTTDLERPEVLVPGAVRGLRVGFPPQLQLVEIAGGDLTIGDAIEEMLAQTRWEIGPPNLRH